ncbi:MAG: hypothetical protein RJA36_2454 [Pseudomonadota bacterium]|jgi:hypothetical protein
MAQRLLATLLLILCATASQAQSYSFGLWGDVPYRKAGDEARLPALIDSINRADIAFSFHDGDIKDGSSRCDDAVYTDALAMFARLRKPVVYVPGDNEWTDCHRASNGGYDPLERLDHLRRVLFAGGRSLGRQTLALARQGEPGQPYVENARFEHRGVTFVTLNMPGSNNNRVLDDKDCGFLSARGRDQCEAANAEYEQRDAANIAWLRTAFAYARAAHSRGLVVVIQADPGFDLPETWDVDESRLPAYSGYRNFVAALTAETEAFAGQVLLVHGDTHYFKVDKPLYGPSRVLPNLTRVETFGSPLTHWVEVTVDPRREQLFEIRPVMVKH